MYCKSNFLSASARGITSYNIAHAQESQERKETFNIGLAGLLVGFMLGYSIHEGMKKPTEKTKEKQILASSKDIEGFLFQTFITENLWKITISSLKFLSGTKNLQLDLLIENLQEEPAECKIYTHEAEWGGPVKETYLLDDLGNEYRISTNPLEDPKKLIPYMPLETQLIFPELKEGSKAIALYLTFTGKNLKTGKWHYRQLYMGLIKIPSESYGEE